jgi:hypothetical protein
MTPKMDPAWKPPGYTIEELDAVRALANGKASETEQILALDWIIKGAANAYGLSYRSESDGGDRETAFAEGRRFVGLQMVKLINLAPKAVAQMRIAEATRRDKT